METKEIGIKLDTTINGKRVELKGRFTALEGMALHRLLGTSTGSDLATNIPVMAAVIERWEFTGPPSDVSAYEALDFFEEFLPLVQFVSEYIGARMDQVGAAKN